MTTNQEERDDLFAARVSLGLRELDGVERAPDVAETVARRLADHEASPRANRWRVSRLAIAAALLGIAVTATLLVEAARGDGPGSAPAVAQDPQGSWRLEYELPVDELQRSVEAKQGKSKEQLLQDCVACVSKRLGTSAVVRRHGASGFTVELDYASRKKVAEVRGLVEASGRVEMRMLADADYQENGVRFDIDKERKQLQAWLDAGGRARLLRDGAAIRDYQAISRQLQWFVRRLHPDPRRPNRWQSRFGPEGNRAVFVNDESDWSGGVIPAHMQAKPLAEQQLLKLVPVNMHEEHFTGRDLDPTGSKVVETQNLFGFHYRLRKPRAAAYAQWTAKHIQKTSAIIWDGEVIQTPTFVSRIPGQGMIDGMTREQAERMLAALTGQLPVMPRLLRQAAGPAASGR